MATQRKASRQRRGFAVVWVWVAGLLIGPPVMARVARPGAETEKPTPWARGVTAAQRTRALALFRRGNHYLSEGRLAEALDRYTQAVKAWDHPAIRYNMVICLVRLKRPLEAYHSVVRALRFGAAPLEDKHQQALTYKDLLLAQLGRITVVTRQQSTRVTVNGEVVLTGAGRATRLVKPGRVQVVASRKGYITQTRQVMVLGGKHEKVRLKLLLISSAVKMRRRWARWMPWTVLGIGVAVAVAGLPLNLQAKADRDKFDQRVQEICSDYPPGGCTAAQLPDSVRDLEDRSRALEVSSYAFFGAGGALIAAGITLVVLNRPRAVGPERRPGSKVRVGLLPVLLPGGGGLSCALSF